jgi:hypothetical protein
MDMQIVGAIKIKDGLFIGDEYAAKVIIKKKFFNKKNNEKLVLNKKN